MAKIPMVRCPQCGHEFSALRADCPNCGLRRSLSDARVSSRPAPRNVRQPREDGGRRRSNWQLIIGLGLIAAAVLAVLLLVFSGRNGSFGGVPLFTPPPTPTPTIEPRPTPTPTPTPKVDNIKIFYMTREILPEEGGFTMYVGDEPLTISARAYPNDKLSDARFSWSVSDPTKARLTPSEDTQSCEVAVLESAGGYITLTVRCFGVEYSVPLYIWSRD